MKKDVTFKSKGLDCAGFLHIPKGVDKNRKAPAIVMAGGISAVKERHLPETAERFEAAGYVVLAFDYRFLGSSEGEPRQQLFPLEQVEDYRSAISWVSELPEVDPNRIGIWGTSMSGGHVLYVASFDKRVKTVISQIPALFNPESRRARDAAKWESDCEFTLKDRIQRYQTGAINYVQVVGKEGERAMSPSRQAYESFMKSPAPTWQNRLTIESMEKILEYDPTAAIHLLTAPCMFVISAADEATAEDALTRAYQKVSGPRNIVMLPISHFDVYNDNWLPKVTDLEIEWCKKYL